MGMKSQRQIGSSSGSRKSTLPVGSYRTKEFEHADSPYLAIACAIENEVKRWQKFGVGRTRPASWERQAPPHLGTEISPDDEPSSMLPLLTFSTTEGTNVTELQLSQCAKLFSEHYGVWDEKGSQISKYLKRGKVSLVVIVHSLMSVLKEPEFL